MGVVFEGYSIVFKYHFGGISFVYICVHLSVLCSPLLVRSCTIDMTAIIIIRSYYY